MNRMVEEIDKICRKVKNLYYREKDENQKGELLKRYYRLSSQLEQAVKTEFNDNDETFLEAIQELKKGNKKLGQLSKELQKIPGIFGNFLRLLDQIDGLLTGILPELS